MKVSQHQKHTVRGFSVGCLVWAPQTSWGVWARVSVDPAAGDGRVHGGPAGAGRGGHGGPGPSQCPAHGGGGPVWLGSRTNDGPGRLRVF